jgi:hypothetical protein
MFRMMILGEQMTEEASCVDLAVQPAQWIVEYGRVRKFENLSPGKFFCGGKHCAASWAAR